MAEALVRRELESYFKGEGLSPRGDFEVMSAGIAALEGDPASAHAVTAMAEAGLDISGHRAVRLTRELVEGADLVLTMTGRHKEAILKLAPGSEGKVYTIGEFTGRGRDYEIPDPFGLSLEEYRKAARELQGAAKEIAERLARDRVNNVGSVGKESVEDEGGHRI